LNYEIAEKLFMMSIYASAKSFISSTAEELNDRAKDRVNRVVNFLFERLHSRRVLSKENKILDMPRVFFYRNMRREGFLDREFVSLPIPTLAKTLDRFMASMEPIMEVEEFLKLKSLKTAFEENEGIELQRNLYCYATWQKNWLTPLWEQYAYLIDRKSLAFGTNYYGLGPLQEPQVAPHLAQKVELRHLRASMAISTALQMLVRIENQTLKDPFSPDPTSLDRDQFSRLFGTTRIPKQQKDEIYQSKAPHFILHLQDCFVKVAFEPGKVPPLHWIVNTIITVEKGLWPSSHSVEILTSLDRDTWAEYRKKLIDLGNRQSLEDIESAQFSIVLDPRSPKDSEEVAQLAQLDSTGKWFDLGVELILFKNGRLAGNLEHTPKDAIITAALIEKIAENEKLNSEKNGGYLSCEEGPGELEFQLIRFQLDKEVQTKIFEAKRIFQETAQMYDLSISTFPDFGKEFIKSQKLSPDSFIQMALQLTYYKIHKKTVLTYETATTRGFQKGRTETIRSQSIFSKRFCEAMENPSEPSVIRKEFLLKAIKYHNDTKIGAMTGEGIDRHILGLRLTAIATKVSSPFLESAAVKQGFILATSQTPIEGCYGGGFLPLEKRGYGISYNAAFADKLVFMISGFKEEQTERAKEFCSVLFESLAQMRTIFVD